MRGSFSSVSKPIFASKYSFCSIFRDLQDLQTFAPLESLQKTMKSHLFKVAGPKTRHGKRSNKRPTRQGGAAKMLRKRKAATTRRSAPEAYCAAENKKGACTDGILQHGTRNLRMPHDQIEVAPRLAKSQNLKARAEHGANTCWGRGKERAAYLCKFM